MGTQGVSKGATAESSLPCIQLLVSYGWEPATPCMTTQQNLLESRACSEALKAYSRLQKAVG